MSAPPKITQRPAATSSAAASKGRVAGSDGRSGGPPRPAPASVPPRVPPRVWSPGAELGAAATRAGERRHPPPPPPVPLTPRQAYAKLMHLDFDGDGRFTRADAQQAQALGTRLCVDLPLSSGAFLRLQAPAQLAHAAEVLGRELRRGRGDLTGLPLEALNASAVGRLTDLATASFQGGLTRTANSIEQLLPALRELLVKSPDGNLRVYVPGGDAEALARLTEEARGHPEVEVLALPRDLTGQWKRLNQQPGIAYLPRPFIAPGGMFQQMYGWDSYFGARGSLTAGRPQMARDMLENQLYALEHYGKIPNSNASYHLSRTQPPLMPALALEVYQATGDRQLLQRAIALGERELSDVFGSARRRTPSGLSRYRDDVEGALPDAPAHWYKDLPDTAEYRAHSRAVRESGWDMTHRFGTRAPDFEPVCLNSLLYRYEKDLARAHQLLEGPASPRGQALHRSADARAQVMRERFWDPARGGFFDFDLRGSRRSGYQSAATFYPLFCGWATPEEARRVAAHVGDFLEAGGLATSTRASKEAAGGEDLQWDWPYGWAPLQLIAVEGLRRYGHHAEANAIAYRWLSMILDDAGGSNGRVHEKYDVVRRSGDVKIEYGNQGHDRGDPLRPPSERAMGFAWTNASLLLLLKSLPPHLRTALDLGIPAEVAAPLNAGAP